jgi:hypothetical protein
VNVNTTTEKYNVTYYKVPSHDICVDFINSQRGNEWSSVEMTSSKYKEQYRKFSEMSISDMILLCEIGDSHINEITFSIFK